MKQAAMTSWYVTDRIKHVAKVGGVLSSSRMELLPSYPHFAWRWFLVKSLPNSRSLLLGEMAEASLASLMGLKMGYGR